MNEYIAIYNETTLDVSADSFYNAQQIAAKQFNTKKSHLVEVTNSHFMNQALARLTIILRRLDRVIY